MLAKYKNRRNLHVNIEPDTGQADAINRGFEKSDGNILGWVNSDDVLLSGALEAVCHIFDENPNIDIIYGDAYFIGPMGTIEGKYPTTRFDQSLLLSTCFLSQPSVFFRKSIFEKVGGLREELNYCLDYNLWLKFYLADATFYYLKKPLSATRVYGTTKTATGGMKFVNEILQMLHDELGYVPNCWKLYYNYSKEKSSNKLWRFIKVTIKLLLNRPRAIAEIAPFSMHIAKNKMSGYFTTFGAPYGKHHSQIGNIAE